MELYKFPARRTCSLLDYENKRCAKNYSLFKTRFKVPLIQRGCVQNPDASSFAGSHWPVPLAIYQTLHHYSNEPNTTGTEMDEPQSNGECFRFITIRDWLNSRLERKENDLKKIIFYPPDTTCSP